MRMMYKIFLIGLLGIFLFESCYDDKGNYSYRAINEITVKHDFFWRHGVTDVFFRGYVAGVS